MAITINLVRDWEDIQLDDFLRFITAWGFESQALERYLNASPGTKEWDDSREEAIMTWFNYLHRRIPAQPRKLAPNPSLVCPAEVAKGWTMLQREVKNGTDLTPRLSRKIENADYNDGMLNDWGFHHFHLGTTFDLKHPRLIQGTSFVLVAIVDPYEFYPIDFVQHDAWGDRAILEKAISAFPNRFEKFCLKGVSDIASPFTGENVAEIRKCGVNIFHKIGDKIYAPPGMGLTMAATSVTATMMLDRDRRRFQSLENQIRERLDAQHRTGEVRLIREPSAENSFKIEVRP